MDDERLMKRALRLAARGLGRTSPNPVVGGVVVKDGAVAGEGWHRRAGEPHAEVVALDAAGDAARGATLYATLEPCPDYGRTPPCVDAIVRAGVQRVVLAARDPRVSGEGVRRLRDAGIEVTEDVLGEEARAQNRPYLKHLRARLPWVVLKMGLSLDGRATVPGRRYDARSRGGAAPQGRYGDDEASKERRDYLTGDEARKHVHRMRDEHDAVMVGARTVLADDPLLTVRDVRGRDPLRVVVDSNALTPPAARVIGRDGRALVVVGEGADAARMAALREAGARVVELPRAGARVDLRAALRWLDANDVLSVLLEGGPTLAGAMLAAALVDQVLFIYAPLIAGDAGIPAIAGAPRELRLRDLRVFRLGADVAVEGLIPPD